VPITYTPAHKHVIDCVLSIFETGRVPTAASYSTCSILADGAGISYGKHQCTDKAGSLDLVVKKYIELGGTHADALKPYLPYLAASTSSTEPPKGPYKAETTALINLLKTAGQDPKMQAAQDEVFDAVYFAPAANHANSAGVTKALSLLVIYDTCIHSGPGGVTNIRNKFAAKSPANGGSEEEWVKSYINARRAWLAASSNALVQKTVYRMDALMELVNAGNWDLKTPLKVRGVSIT
jgi:chitosanase